MEAGTRIPVQTHLSALRLLFVSENIAPDDLGDFSARRSRKSSAQGRKGACGQLSPAPTLREEERSLAFPGEGCLCYPGLTSEELTAAPRPLHPPAAALSGRPMGDGIPRGWTFLSMTSQEEAEPGGWLGGLGPLLRLTLPPLRGLALRGWHPRPSPARPKRTSQPALVSTRPQLSWGH